MRTILLHYHLFKNAGTSLDRILKVNFGEKWVTSEFSGTHNNTPEVEDWMRNTPDAVAFSSHTMVGPLPQVEGVRVVPIMIFREPVARIHSAYSFERKQDAETWGAELAKEHDFEGYVRARLARTGDRQCRDFQVARLATLCPGPEPETDRALDALAILRRDGVVGRVEAFDLMMEKLAKRLDGDFPQFSWESTRANVSTKAKDELTPELYELLQTANEGDLFLWGRVKATE